MPGMRDVEQDDRIFVPEEQFQRLWARFGKTDGVVGLEEGPEGFIHGLKSWHTNGTNDIGEVGVFRGVRNPL
jgi:hypothetical protein